MRSKYEGDFLAFATQPNEIGTRRTVAEIRKILGAPPTANINSFLQRQQNRLLKQESKYWLRRRKGGRGTAANGSLPDVWWIQERKYNYPVQ